MNALARGLAAGAAGTAAMTVSQLSEMRVTGRESSDVPGKVAEGLTGIERYAAAASAVYEGLDR